MEDVPTAVLEPAFGAGVFVEAMPNAWRETAKVEAVEMDTLTAKMAQAHFADVSLKCMPFQRYISSKQFEVVIGNPPYGSAVVDDETFWPELNGNRIHHYFVAKAFRYVKVGGYLAMVLPSYFLDKSKQHVRDVIAQDGGRLVAAWRFPCDLFENAKVTVDCVIIQRMDSPQSNEWTKTGRVCIDGVSDTIAQYFIDNPSHILGKLAVATIRGRKQLECRRDGTGLNAWKQQIATLGTTRVEPDANLAKLDALIADSEKSITNSRQQLAILQKARQDYLDNIATIARLTQ
jgi:predicted RNA methylase